MQATQLRINPLRLFLTSKEANFDACQIDNKSCYPQPPVMLRSLVLTIPWRYFDQYAYICSQIYLSGLKVLLRLEVNLQKIFIFSEFRLPILDEM